MNQLEIDLHLGTPDMKIVDAMKAIDGNRHGILFILDKDEKMIGSLTDGDIRRWIIRTGDLQAEIREAMNTNPKYAFENVDASYGEIMSRYSILALPILSADYHIRDIVLIDTKVQGNRREKTDGLKDVPVVIMAGGKGTRLEPYTKILPKPLIPIGDIPIIERIIQRFVDHGVEDYFVSVNYKKEMIRSYFQEVNPDYRLHFVEEEKPLGTAGGIRRIEERFSQPFFVTNCDILIDADYEKMFRFHVESGNALTIVSSLKGIEVPYGVLNVKEQGIVDSMQEKPKLSYLINTGMYIMNPECIDFIPEEEIFHMPELAAKLMEQGHKVGTYPISEDSFLDMGQFEEMRRMEEKLNLN